jgi:CBS domain-containing protein
MACVRDILNSRILSHVCENDTVAQAARQMTELHVGAILVLNNGELRGIFSERDLMSRVVARGLDPDATLVQSVMSTELATIDETATVEQAMAAMQTHMCRHLPVMQEGRVAAFLSMRDLMKYELALKTEENIHMRAFIQTNA